MRIGILAKRSGLSVDTIRFYEKKGLLDLDIIIRQNNNYRDYSAANLERLRFIQQAKQLGFTLAEIKDWIQGIKSDRLTTVEKSEIVSHEIKEIDKKIDELKKMKIPLFACLVKYQSKA